MKLHFFSIHSLPSHARRKDLLIVSISVALMPALSNVAIRVVCFIFAFFADQVKRLTICCAFFQILSSACDAAQTVNQIRYPNRFNNHNFTK